MGAIRRNSIFRDHANELRLARVNGLLTYAQDQSPASAVGQVLVEGRKAEEGQVAEAEVSLGQADLLLLAADDVETQPSNNQLQERRNTLHHALARRARESRRRGQ